MFNAILAILEIMGWLGVILAMLLFVNTSCKTLYNVGYKGENFQWKKMLKGIVKAIFFYLGAALTAVSFTLLPFVNTYRYKQQQKLPCGAFSRGYRSAQ